MAQANTKAATATATATATKATTTKATATKATTKATTKGAAVAVKGTAQHGTAKAQAPALAGKLAGLPQTMAAGHFVAVHALANPKAQGSGAYNRYAALLALVAKHGNGKFTCAQWAAVVQRASDLRYNTGANGYGKAFVTVHATQALALAAIAPKATKAKAPKAKAAPATPAPAATPAAQ